MKIIVGSKNPVKIEATRSAFSHYFNNTEVIGIKVDSGVSHMPMNEDETMKGAINRAKQSLIFDEADFGVGLEGGVEDTEYGMTLFGRVAIIDKKGNIGISGSKGFLLPENVAGRIRNGEELGPVMDDIMNMKDLKKKDGAIGIFSKGKISRTEAFENSVILALVKFINKETYELK